ncbi:MAG: ABC transporter permease [Victivallaceae bacterium]|nr:ABC transporter permease [Victivallaceae bacterium]
MVRNKVKDFVTGVGRGTYDEVSGAVNRIGFVGDVVSAVAEVVVSPRKLRWRDVLYYLDLCGRKSVPIVAAICFLMGAIVAFQSAFQMRKYGAELYVADLLAFSLLKELGPLMVAVIATGRAGSSFAAEIGTMKVDEEINALETMGIKPVRFLVIPKLLAMMVSLPLLTVIGDVVGILGGLTVAQVYLGMPASTYMARTIDVLVPSVFCMGVLKTVFFAICITLIGCHCGFAAGTDAQGVGRATTRAVVSGIFAVVLGDAVLTLIYMAWGY